MTPLEPASPDRTEFLRQAANVRMASQLLRQAAQEARDRSLIACTRSRLLLERSARAAAKVERDRAEPLQSRDRAASS